MGWREENRKKALVIIYTKHSLFLHATNQLHVRIQRGDRGSGPPPPLKNHKNIGSLSNTGPDPLKKSQIYVASIQCWAIIEKQFKWRADDGPILVVFGSTH